MKNTIFALFGRDALLFLSTLITGIIIARYLGPEMMGVWAILLLIPGYAEAFGRLKFDVASVYFFGKKEASLGDLTFLLHFISIVSSMIMLTVFVVF